MRHARIHIGRPACYSLVLSAALTAASALAAQDSASNEARDRYHAERAACLNGPSSQDQATCLREAGAAYADAKRGRLEDGPVDYAANALKRCAQLPSEERTECEARMHGEGTTSGSVAGGGIYRELVTRNGVPVSTAQP